MGGTGVERGAEKGAAAPTRKRAAGEGGDVFRKVQTPVARRSPGNSSGTAQGETRIHRAIPNLPPAHIRLPVVVGMGAKPSALQAKQRSRGSAGTPGPKTPGLPAAARGKRGCGATGCPGTPEPLPRGPSPGGCLSVGSGGGRSIRSDLHGNPRRAAGKALIGSADLAETLGAIGRR